MLEALGGVEPPTCGLGNRRSIHLSYRATDQSISPLSHERYETQTKPDLCFFAPATPWKSTDSSRKSAGFPAYLNTTLYSGGANKAFISPQVLLLFRYQLRMQPM